MAPFRGEAGWVQMLVLSALVEEMLQQEVLALVRTILHWLLVGAVAGLVIYAPRTIAWAVKYGGSEAVRTQTMEALGVSALEFEPPLPEWHML